MHDYVFALRMQHIILLTFFYRTFLDVRCMHTRIDVYFWRYQLLRLQIQLFLRLAGGVVTS